MVSAEAIHLPVEPGFRLCLVHHPEGKPRGVVIHVPAFAEEMNKARRQVALAARAMARSGYAVVVPDLFGCGDSSGEFGDARWDLWLDDVLALCRWAEGRFGAPLWLWGLRAGALLSVEAARQVDGCNLLLWQPVVAGRLHLTQFLRLKVASEALAEAATRSETKAIFARLLAGAPEEIAGYCLSPSIARGLDAAQLAMPESFSGQVLWFEVAVGDPPELAPRSRLVIDALAGRGLEVVAQAVSGPAFWQTVEISECPALVEATAEAMESLP